MSLPHSSWDNTVLQGSSGLSNDITQGETLCSAMGLILPGGFRQEKVHEDEKEHVSGLEFSCYAPGNAHQRKYHCLLCTDIELAP